jgi:hypothetical protein
VQKAGFLLAIAMAADDRLPDEYIARFGLLHIAPKFGKFMNLVPEVQAIIVSHLPQASLHAMSRTNSRFTGMARRYL